MGRKQPRVTPDSSALDQEVMEIVTAVHSFS